MDKIITKVSDTEVKITKTIPEVVIPEKIEEEVVSLKDVKNNIINIDQLIAEWTSYRATPLAELAKIDAKITELEALKADTLAIVVEAEKQGVKEAVEPVKEVPVDVKPVAEEPLPVEEPIVPVGK